MWLLSNDHYNVIVTDIPAIVELSLSQMLVGVAQAVIARIKAIVYGGLVPHNNSLLSGLQVSFLIIEVIASDAIIGVYVMLGTGVGLTVRDIAVFNLPSCELTHLHVIMVQVLSY